MTAAFSCMIPKVHCSHIQCRKRGYNYSPFSLSIICICGIADLYNLCVLHCCTLNFPCFLVIILCVLSFLENISFMVPFLKLFLAKFKHNLFLLCFRVSNSNIIRAFLYGVVSIIQLFNCRNLNCLGNHLIPPPPTHPH